MVLFTPTEGVKKRCKRQVEEGCKGAFKNIINTFDIKAQYKRGGTTGIKEHFSTLYGVKQ